MSEREQAVRMLENVPDYQLHIVLAVLKELTFSEDYVERALDEADFEAEHSSERLTHEEVFGSMRRKLNGML